jgi:hypothetical protein
MEDWAAWSKASLFPDWLDPVLMRTVKPLFVRGDFHIAVLRAFKEVEVRVRKKDPSLASEFGVDLMTRFSGPAVP